MKTIDLSTSQNATITYELAPLGLRILAFIIDAVLISLMVGLLELIINLLPFEATDFLEYLLIIPLLSFYSLLCESIFSGQTIGKIALGLKVVKINGHRLELFDLVMRWAFRMIDIWFSAGSIASVLIVTSDNNQRLGDMISNTTVIKLRSGMSINLDDLLKINTLQDYQPQYPEVRKFSESDMLLVKHVMERYQRYKNMAHKQAVEECAIKLCQEMGVRETPADSYEFLRTAVKDYIVLTR
ncbi:MAG: RDD family protein [Flavobacteriales bacterium]|nr:RDD family protein [Flavobacteriales bacterium]